MLQDDGGSCFASVPVAGFTPLLVARTGHHLPFTRATTKKTSGRVGFGAYTSACAPRTWRGSQLPLTQLCWGVQKHRCHDRIELVDMTCMLLTIQVYVILIANVIYYLSTYLSIYLHKCYLSRSPSAFW